MNKQLLAAGIVRDLRFTSQQSYRAYLIGLENKKILYQVLYSALCQDGSVIAIIVTSYNGSPLIELPQCNLAL